MMQQKTGIQEGPDFDIYGTGLRMPVGVKTGGQIPLTAGIHSREYMGIQALVEELQPGGIFGGGRGVRFPSRPYDWPAYPISSNPVQRMVFIVGRGGETAPPL